MIYFLLPKNNIQTYKSIFTTFSDEPPHPSISNSLYYYLSDIKMKINDYEKEWDIFKKHTNPYEYIHTMIPNKKKYVSKYKPLSRSYFKMIEIIHTFNLDSGMVSEGFTKPKSEQNLDSLSSLVTKTFGCLRTAEPPSRGSNHVEGIVYPPTTNGMFSLVKDGRKLTNNGERSSELFDGFTKPLEGFVEPSFGKAAQNLDSLSRIPERNPTTNENLRFSGHAEQNLDSFPYATKGCSVEDPLGPLTRISKADSEKNGDIKSFHLAEGPGGFIEALVQLRKNSQKTNQQNTGDVYIGMTILDNNSMVDDYNIPAWKKSQQFLKENPNVFIENGADGTGNILNIENFVYCKEKYASSMDLITADGGFDFSNDFNNQEISIANLLFAQIAFALCMQKKNGSFVLKIFDCFMPHTIDLLFILSSFYDKVYITKPQTSRYANSEKYIVCKKFLFSSCDDFYPFLYEAFTAIYKGKNHIYRFLNIPISNYFLTKLEEYNSIFGQQQIENIYYTISLIETKNKAEKIDMLIKTNIQKCIQWCMKYDVSYNIITGNANIFLTSTI